MIEQLEVRAKDSGLVVPVHAQPGARRNRVVGIHGGRIKVAVTQKPESGKANRAICQVLAEALHVPPSQLELISGATSRIKSVFVAGMSEAEFRRRIAEHLK